MSTIAIGSLTYLSGTEADAYLAAASGDEVLAAYLLAKDRNLLDGSTAEPDDTEVHHALFLLRRARGSEPPSFDMFRLELRRRLAA